MILQRTIKVGKLVRTIDVYTRIEHTVSQLKLKMVG